MNLRILALSLSRALTGSWRHKLLQRYESLETIAQLSDDEIQAFIGKRNLESIPALLMRAEKIYKFCQKEGIEIITIADEAYAEKLKHIYNPPWVIYRRAQRSGQIFSEEQGVLALVGTRKALPFMSDWTRNLASALKQAGAGVVSGLARGIDKAAHEGAMGSSGHVAVLAHGLDRVYPRSNLSLAKDIILSGGALISEYPPGVLPQTYHFPQRNRIISALSDTVLVAQSAKRSGALITANYALEQGKNLFAYQPQKPLACFEGNLNLLQQGASALHRIQDWNTLFGSENVESQHLQEEKESFIYEQPWLDSLRYFPKTAEELARSSGLPLAQVLAKLVELRMKGRLAVDEGQRYFIKLVNKILRENSPQYS